MQNTILKIVLGLFLLTAKAEAKSCQYLFAKAEDIYYVKTSGAKIDYRSQLYTELNTTNFANVFSHNYHGPDVTIFGAKAIVLLLPNQPPDVYFFATGVGRVSWNVHHMRAVQTILREKFGFQILNDVLVHWPYVQGYEFTAKRDQYGLLRITKLQIESQITRLRKMEMRERVNLNFELEALQALLGRMDSSLNSDDFSISVPWLN